MFSVDNFYSFMQSSYGRRCKDTVLYKNPNNGSKNLYEIVPYYEGPSLSLSLHGCMIMHDQEPFMVNYLNTYRDHKYKTNNFQDHWIKMEDHEMFLLIARTLHWPIFCHSEENSSDIQWLEKHGVIGCHYLWHGLIARDWYRHWKHHPVLSTENQWSQRFLLYARDTSGTRTYRKNLLEDLYSIKSNIRHNWRGEKNVSPDFSAMIDVKDAVKSAIHIVAETLFDHDKIHATEKVFKPMVMRQPFIVFAGAGMLSYLRRYGFKTFDGIWDESYDLEPNHSVRYNKLVTLIKHLNSLPRREFAAVMAKCQDILDHNRNHFYSEKFESIMLDELRKNVETSIDTQKYLAMDDPGGSLFYTVDKLKSRGVGLTPWTQMTLDYYLTLSNNERIQRIKKQYPWFGQ